MDLVTLAITTFFLSLIMAATMFSLRYAIPREPCLVDWACADLLHCVAALVGWVGIAGGTLPWSFTALSNAAYLCGNAMIATGIFRFMGMRVRRHWTVALALAVFCFNFIPAVHASFAVRVSLLYPVLVAMSIVTAIQLMRRREPGMTAVYSALAAVEGLYALQATIRTPFFVFERGREMPFTSGKLFNSAGSLATLLFILLVNMACALVIVRKQELMLRDAALRDSLTGWNNRRAFDDHATRRFARRDHARETFGLIVMDIDHFKKINDQHGHAVGDAAIRHIASVAARMFRPYDFLARIGGEEFCAIVDDATTTDLHEVAERLRGAIEGSTLEADGVSLAMTVSVGYSRGSRSDASWNDVFSRADAALYRAKNSGRNLVGHPVDGNELPLPKAPLANRNSALTTARMSNSSA